jgi:hypothetical protein
MRARRRVKKLTTRVIWEAEQSTEAEPGAGCSGDPITLHNASLRCDMAAGLT